MRALIVFAALCHIAIASAEDEANPWGDFMASPTADKMYGADLQKDAKKVSDYVQAEQQKSTADAIAKGEREKAAKKEAEERKLKMDEEMGSLHAAAEEFKKRRAAELAKEDPVAAKAANDAAAKETAEQDAKDAAEEKEQDEVYFEMAKEAPSEWDDKIKKMEARIAKKKAAKAGTKPTSLAQIPSEEEEDVHPAVIALATNAGAEGTDAKAQRVRTLAAAKQLMKLMNVAAMSEERAKELIDEARKADAEADLVRAPIQDHSDKKARYHRAKTLQNAQSLNLNAAQAVVKARKLAGMVRELKESAKAKSA